MLLSIHNSNAKLLLVADGFGMKRGTIQMYKCRNYQVPSNLGNHLKRSGTYATIANNINFQSIAEPSHKNYFQIYFLSAITVELLAT